MMSWRNSQVLYCDLDTDWIRLNSNGQTLALPIARDASGRMSPEGKSSLSQGLKQGLQQLGVKPGTSLWCSIPARGVALRRITLPPGDRTDKDSMLALKIESEFPLPPEALAWGALPIQGGKLHLVAAFRREVLSDFDELFSAEGLVPAYVLSCMVRASSLESPGPRFALLEVGAEHSEWVVFDEGQPTSARHIPIGESEMIRAAAEKFGLDPESARARLAQASSQKPEAVQSALEVLAAVLSPVIEILRGLSPARHIYVTNRTGWSMLISEALNQGLNAPSMCRPLPSPPSPNGTATLDSLRKTIESHPESLLAIRLQPATQSAAGNSASAKWRPFLAPTACLLALAALPWFEPLIFTKSLERKLAVVRADKTRLALIDREFSFLQYLKENQPPYTEAMYVIADASPGGVRLNALNMNRRGEVSIRLAIRDPMQVGTFRSKLLASGFFSSAVIEEQSMAQGQQMLNVRMSAQWKPLAERETLSLSPPAAELAKFMPKTNSPSTNAEPKSAGAATNSPANTANKKSSP